MIIAGFLPNILCEGKDFMATWFPGFPLLSHPDLKYKVVVDEQVYKIMEVNPAKEGFVIKFKMKKSPAQGWFNLAKDFRLYTRNTVYLVRQDPG